MGAALLGGLALYLLAHVAFRLRNTGTLSRRRVVAAVLLVALVPVSAEVDALVALAAATVVMVVLVTYEAIRFAEARDDIRHKGMVRAPQ